MLNWFWSENHADEPRNVPMKPDPADAVRTAAYVAKQAEELKARQAVRDHKENIRAEARELAKNQPEIAELSTHKKDPRDRKFENENHADVLKVHAKMEHAQKKWPTKGQMAMFKHAEVKAVQVKTEELTKDLHKCVAAWQLDR